LIDQINVQQLDAWLSDPERLTKPIILDVREDWEFERAKVSGSVHIPMGQIVQRIDELKSIVAAGQVVACLCHHGSRSMQVGMYLHRQGFDNVINVSGGIDAWSEQIDANVAKY
jgi:rhodanese-related sulfurtransferase